MPLDSLLVRFPLMARMALRWPLLAKRVSCQSSPLANTPAHTPSQLPRLRAEPQGTAAKPLPTSSTPHTRSFAR